MSLWARLFGRTSSAPSDSIVGHADKANAAAWNDTQKRAVRGALARLAAAGLRIRPTLDRDVIVVRGLRDLADRYGRAGLDAFLESEDIVGEEISLDLALLRALSSGTDAFLDVDGVDALFPHLSALSDEALAGVLDDHSYSIFANATSVRIVNEQEPDDYVRHHVDELAGLGYGDFEIESIETSQNADRIVGRVTLASGQSGAFEFGSEKRPDLTPFFKAMNDLVEPVAKACFLAVDTGDNEDIVILYLCRNEQVAFRDWEKSQFFAVGSSPVDWFE
jgi:hypothetical protein